MATPALSRVELDYSGGERLTMNMGPQHPSAHGVFRMILTLEGETIVGVDPIIGYLHRCHEKLGEMLTNGASAEALFASFGKHVHRDFKFTGVFLISPNGDVLSGMVEGAPVSPSRPAMRGTARRPRGSPR